MAIDKGWEKSISETYATILR